MTQTFPNIDAHFWVVRDDKIIDWDFDEYRYTFSQFNCKNEKQYIPAPEITQVLMIKMFNNVLINRFSKKNQPKKELDQVVKEFYELSIKWGKNTPQFNCCFQNCIMEIYKNGGKLVFGSLGFKINNSNDYHYEYGGKDWKTIKDFLK